MLEIVVFGVFMFHCFRVSTHVSTRWLRWARVRQAFWKPCAFYVPNLRGKKPKLTNRTCRHWLVVLTHIYIVWGLKRGLFKRKGWLEWLAIRKSGLKKNWDWFGWQEHTFSWGFHHVIPRKPSMRVNWGYGIFDAALRVEYSDMEVSQDSLHRKVEYWCNLVFRYQKLVDKRRWEQYTLEDSHGI